MPERVSGYPSLLKAVEARLPPSQLPMIIAITGPPAAGKSTLAGKIVDDLDAAGQSTCYCPLDGFHRTNAELESGSLCSVKGRIDTFNAPAFAHAVARIGARETFWWPLYSRDRHDPVPEGTRVKGTETVCVIEGNYILAEEEPWRSAAAFYSLRIFVDAPDAALQERLLQRHLRGGRSESEAREKIRQTDFPNARTIRESAASADIDFAEAACC